MRVETHCEYSVAVIYWNSTLSVAVLQLSTVVRGEKVTESTVLPYSDKS